MGKFALIYNSLFVGIDDVPDVNTVEELYALRDRGLLYVDITNETRPLGLGWTYDGTDFSPPTAEYLMRPIRYERNRRLKNCDWTQLIDAPLTEEMVAEWSVYRQALRDFPATCNINAPVWPTEPTEE